MEYRKRFQGCDGRQNQIAIGDGRFATGISDYSRWQLWLRIAKQANDYIFFKGRGTESAHLYLQYK